jgi:hypothetical protein
LLRRNVFVTTSLPDFFFESKIIPAAAEAGVPATDACLVVSLDVFVMIDLPDVRVAPPPSHVWM